ncbi:MAG: hypothetical protein K9M57_02435, partial [Phycisphaerae bacterium]|nr:hypothetical protein [Phycisphaerae bacterium]
MRIFTRRFIVLMGLLGLINCVGLLWINFNLTRLPKESVSIRSVYPKDNAEKFDRIGLLFDRKVVTETSIGSTETGEIFTLDPPSPGKWVWVQADKLEYCLEEPLQPGRKYQIIAHEAIIAARGKVLVGEKIFEIKTSPLKLLNCKMIAKDRYSATLDFEFNQPVAPGELIRHLKISDRQRDTNKLDSITSLSKEPASKIALQVQRHDCNKMKVTVDKDLKGNQGDLPLKYDSSWNIEIPQNFSLLSSYVYHQGLDETTTITLSFSDELATDQALNNIKIDPEPSDVTLSGDRSNLVINGVFTCDKNYKITLPKTLYNTNNQTLGEDTTTSVHIPNRRTDIAFTHNKGILSPDGNMALDIKAVNVKEVHFSTWRLHANNLVTHLHNNATSETSRSIATKTITMDLHHNQIQDVVLDLNELLKNPLGIYRINANVPGRWSSDQALVTVSDLAITTKLEKNASLIWVTSLKSGLPVKDVTIKAFSANNQVLTTARTDDNGLAHLKLQPNHPDGKLWVVTAEKANDLNYLIPGDSQWMLDNVAQSGRQYASTYEVMLYGERGVYRPGSTIYMTGIIRDKEGNIPPEFPLSVDVYRPDNKKVKILIADTKKNQQGVFHVSFQTDTNGQTGPYRFVATLPGGGKTLGSVTVLVENFVPARMEVTTKTNSEHYYKSDPIEVAILGKYLWGQAASGIPSKVEGFLQAIPYKSKKYPKYHFGTDEKMKVINLRSLNTKLDDNGTANTKVELPKDLQQGLYKIYLTGTVTEPGGRSVSSNATAILDQVDRHIGLYQPRNVVAVNTPGKINWVRLDGKDQPATPGEMKMTFDKINYDTSLKEVNGRMVWQSNERYQEIESYVISPQDANDTTVGNFEINCRFTGMYRVTLTDTETQSSSQIEFYASSYASSKVSVAMNQPEHLEIIPDKNIYQPGETAKILVQSPIPGTLLLALETDKIMANHIVEITENSAQLELKLPSNIRGSAYLTASVVNKIDPTQEKWLPHRAMGMARVKIDHQANAVPVNLDIIGDIKPANTVEVAIDAGMPLDPNRPGVVHVWAVDEGILLTTAYKTPDPFKYFLSPRSPGVMTSDVFYRLLPDQKRPEGMIRIGAGGEGEPGFDPLQRSPVAVKQTKETVIWRESVVLDKNGKAKIPMDLPDYIGRLRLMATGIDHDNYGKTDKAIILTKPII